MIGKTRQDEAQIVEVYDAKAGPPRGMLRMPVAAGKFHHARRTPDENLEFLIAHFWLIDWDLRGCEPHYGESLPHPNVHLVFGEGEAMIHGVQTNKFARTLEGRSRVFGVKFKPGGFRPFYSAPVSELADRSIPAADVFKEGLHALGTIAISDRTEEEKIAAANSFFLDRLPTKDGAIEQATHLVDTILNEPEITTVDHLVDHSGLGKRSLQRLFNEYVGVSPKWVIRRYRLHELIERMNTGEELDWAGVAVDLGYFDQAHLINDFKEFIGHTPANYRKLIKTKTE